MKRLILVLITGLAILSCASLTQALPPPCVECKPEIAFQSRLLCLPLLMLVVSCDYDVAFDQYSEVKIMSDEIIKFDQIYINKDIIMVFALILPAGLEAVPSERKIISVEVNTLDGYVGTVLWLVSW